MLTFEYKIKETMTTETTKNKIEQQNTYAVYYSNGRDIMDWITASNLKEAREIAKTRKYTTAYYQVKRAYNGGVRG